MLPFYLAWNFLANGQRSGFVRLTVWLAAIGIILGVLTLNAVSAVMNGFQTEIQSKLFGISEHIVVRFYEPQKMDMEQFAFKDERIKAVSPFLITAGIFQNQGISSPAVLLGIDPERVNYSSMIEDGHVFHALKPGSFEVITGMALSRSIGWATGHKALLLTAPQADQLFMDVNMKRLKLMRSVKFKSGKRLEEKMAFMHLHDLQRLTGLDGQVSGYNIHLHDLYAAPDLREKLAKQWGAGAFVNDWTQQYQELFSALRLQKTVMVILLGLIIVIALFNLVTGQVMLVNERRTSIAILSTCGMSRFKIVAIFLVQGVLLATLGILIGTALGYYVAQNIGTWVSFIENAYNIQLISAKVYMVDHLPCEFRASDALTIALITAVLTLICSAYPARLAGQIHPARTLRYE